MSKHSLTALPFTGNCERIEQPKYSRNQNLSSSEFSQHSKNSKIRSGSLDYSIARKIIEKLLNCNRIVMVPTKTPGFTEIELAKELNISLLQLQSLLDSPTFFQEMVRKINLPLIKLLCKTRFDNSDIEKNHSSHLGTNRLLIRSRRSHILESLFT